MSRNYKFHKPDGVYFVSFAVTEGLVFRAEDYLYSSATDYAGELGILHDVIVVK